MSAPSSAPPLPARVRVSRLPLPPAPSVEARLKSLFAAQLVTHHLADLKAGAVAVAGGKIIGAALRWPAGSADCPEVAELESGWRGRGIEAALRALLESEPDPDPANAQTAQP
ncbi:hypothetical protein GCM10022631_21140 [Deinococcus rubellus]|uniref:N-acetyltransferase n=1 Tax=Deinococcus rubellus TaxID=1889240 RepID=A0ABY5YI27_9DEIO|nr:hypothetical protein [Deinococcus rubellus]UWX64465.1 hypothetical protein N0D28_01995 [Deinococcus rubellus]